MSNLDPRIEAIRIKYDLERSDFWELPQKKGTWVCKHAALEIVAVKADIQFEAPQIIEADTANGIAVLSVLGMMYQAVPGTSGEDKGTRHELRREWSTGEASSKNNKNAYPWAMAEKRAKDRVILKLVGIHGLVYSEDEMSDTPVQTETRAQVQTEPAPKPLTVAERKALWSVMMDDLKAEAPKGWRKMAAYIIDPETKRLIESLGSYKQQFLDEARDIVKIAQEAERELGEPVGGLKTTAYNFDQLENGSTVGDMLDATENAE